MMGRTPNTDKRPKSADDKRFDQAVDIVMNSGPMYAYVDDWWKFLDRKISVAEFRRRMG